MHNKTPGIRLIIRGFDSHITYGAVQHFLDKIKPEYCLFLYDPNHFPNRPPLRPVENVKVEEICIHELVAGIFPCDVKIKPLSEEFLYEMRSCEVDCLKMMDRMDPDHLWSYQKRKKIYLDYLRKWKSYIDERKLNTYISHTVPHHPIDFIPYNLIRHNSGKTLFLDKIPIPGRLFDSENWELHGIAFKHQYDQFLLDMNKHDSFVLEPEFEEHFKMQTDTKMPSYLHIEHYTKENKPLLELGKRFSANIFLLLKNVPLKEKIRKIFSPFSWFNYFQYRKKVIKQNQEEKKILSFYDDHISAVDLSKPFIFVPLHLQPEATTSPFGGAFVDQELMISILSHSIPHDWSLYIKENKFQGKECRSCSFYKELLNHKNVRFLSRSHPSLDYVLNCKAVATVTGTAGWEALHRQKPVLVFGHSFYQFAPGVFKVNSLESCKEAIQKIASGFRPTLWEIRLFLKAIQHKTFKGICEQRFDEILEINREKNSETIGFSVAEKLVQ